MVNEMDEKQVLRDETLFWDIIDANSDPAVICLESIGIPIAIDAAFVRANQTRSQELDTFCRGYELQ